MLPGHYEDEPLSPLDPGGSREALPVRRLVCLGVVVHLLLVASIFDIHFQTPVVHGLQPEWPEGEAPAKRLVVVVADGLRADALYAWDGAKPRAPFLHEIATKRGRWGVSHARPPTESRPGHVALLAGFYEDPSAITKGWQANAVEFDHLLNRSSAAWAMGSPDIVPLFTRGLAHAAGVSYHPTLQDFGSGDLALLDVWAFDALESLLLRAHGKPPLAEPSYSDPRRPPSDDWRHQYARNAWAEVREAAGAELAAKLHGDRAVIFLHLLGADSNGHAFRPSSHEYLHNVEVIDAGLRRLEHVVEEFFEHDNQTAYLFTADHGMSAKGSHGDGDPANTHTPLLAWGAGVAPPPPPPGHGAAPAAAPPPHGLAAAYHQAHLDGCGARGVTPHNWHLPDTAREDVDQADVAPLAAALVGLPVPLNSVGLLPASYLSVPAPRRAALLLANAAQLLSQARAKQRHAQARSLAATFGFRPFPPLQDGAARLAALRATHRDGAAAVAEEGARGLAQHALEAVHYYHTYDTALLQAVITAAYAGWVALLATHLARAFWPRGAAAGQAAAGGVERAAMLAGGGALLAVGALLVHRGAPPLYYAYCSMPILFWTEVARLGGLRRAGAAARAAAAGGAAATGTAAARVAAVVVSLEFLVWGFFDREVHTPGLLILAAALYLKGAPECRRARRALAGAAAALSVFTVLPVHHGEHATLVLAGGGAVLAVAATLAALQTAGWVPLSREAVQGVGEPWGRCGWRQEEAGFWRGLGATQAALVAAACFLAHRTSALRDARLGLPLSYQLAVWAVSLGALGLPLLAPPRYLVRLCSLLLGTAPAYILFSVAYEPLFLAALAATLLAWMALEVAWGRAAAGGGVGVGMGGGRLRVAVGNRDAQRLCWSDARLGVAWLAFNNMAFFGTGNFASIASFELSSVYRFTTVFNPWLMGALLMLKLTIPFLLVACSFCALLRALRRPLHGVYFVVLGLSDLMSVHFFFRVTSVGSWMEIGNSLSRFGILNTQVIFVLVLFAIARVFTGDLLLGGDRDAAGASIPHSFSSSHGLCLTPAASVRASPSASHLVEKTE